MDAIFEIKQKSNFDLLGLGARHIAQFSRSARTIRSPSHAPFSLLPQLTQHLRRSSSFHYFPTIYNTFIHLSFAHSNPRLLVLPSIRNTVTSINHTHLLIASNSYSFIRINTTSNLSDAISSPKLSVQSSTYLQLTNLAVRARVSIVRITISKTKIYYNPTYCWRLHYHR